MTVIFPPNLCVGFERSHRLKYANISQIDDKLLDLAVV